LKESVWSDLSELLLEVDRGLCPEGVRVMVCGCVFDWPVSRDNVQVLCVDCKGYRVDQAEVRGVSGDFDVVIDDGTVEDEALASGAL
jgi:hypothetical protein